MRSPSEQIRSDVLVLRCQEGDAAAFESLVLVWQERLWRHARRLTGDEDAADDIPQESWLAIGRGMSRLQDPAAFSAWAYRIVSNKCNDWIRRECRRRKGQATYAGAWAVGNGDPPHHQGERSESLRQALARLPGAALGLLAPKCEEGFDTSQIGYSPPRQSRCGGISAAGQPRRMMRPPSPCADCRAVRVPSGSAAWLS